MSEPKSCSAALPPGFTMRPIAAADGAVVLDLLNDYAELTMGLRKLSEEEFHGLFSLPAFDAENSTRLVLSPQGQAVGCAVVTDFASPPVHPGVIGCVHPDFERRGIGTVLLQWAIERGRQAVARVPDGARVSLYFTLLGQHEPTQRLFDRFDLQPIRHSWLMAIDLEQKPPQPRLPQGIVVRTFEERPDVRTVYHAVNDAFQDHWGHVTRPEEEAVQRWQHSIANDPTFDPSLWFLAMEGEEIAGIALCRGHAGEDSSTAFVDTLGVRRPWRCQGLGLSLLHHAFGEFYRRGKAHAALGVDAGSLTGATRLYQKAGMRVAQHATTYELELRPGQELGRRSLD